MNDTADVQFTNDSQHSLQWSAFKPRAIASKPLPLTNFDNPLPFISIASDHDKRKWDNQDKGFGVEMDTTEAKARRKAQNRAAQRAFRERKEKYVHELETKIKHMEQAHKQETDRLLETNQNLMTLIQKLEAEIVHLKSKSLSSINTPSLSMNTPESAADNMRSDYSGSPRSEDRIRDPDAMDISTGPHEEASTPSKSNLGSRHCGSGCHTTKDGVSFCEKLKDEVCTSAYERLLSESIFDTSGEVNNSIEPVPIVTSPINGDGMEHSKQRRSNKFSTFRRNFLPDSPEEEDSDEYDLASGTSDAFKHEPHPATMQPGKQLITCSQVWERLCEHPQFEEFDIDELCVQLKLKAKCSGSGPVIEEDELHEVLEALESKLARDSRR
ncbi:hypothetical protein K450DRAFT_228987 [Umbelopsis ramanniana AG]|uniref:BZIP domain-containing protein n=1 Tax=Umbelopsis ramanniana AG TaxID=1314678 RepID=A0AAD5HF69_UMBRA|nr:uncharacterized protein K450DRAFT_228987 [Umbelopsis ramanniana AG]KAI8582092.1 hypothetical protein K450DRAFT_228987 [Umbelopsis ramanniana AG]